MSTNKISGQKVSNRPMSWKNRDVSQIYYSNNRSEEPGMCGKNIQCSTED